MIRVCIILIALMALPVQAVEPDEILSDVAQEARAREISKNLRCLICRNENIDSSNAGIAKDLRILVRERIVAGDSNEQVIDFVVDRYGEYVLLQPRRSWGNLLLWLAGPLMLLFGGYIGLRTIKTGGDAPAQDLTPEEQQRLKDLMRD
ncbi:cytochrome c biogenesis protein CcdA [Amylibacter marinus]|uniref:Cytochrome c-type biogenesis protein n=1 Tax=Amylibacter marinus TaxID=1475483 RepID=A0ABQ5VTF4_9RHOB|nr:cytochrome c-type biogenesis protein [Amylibacter marinus]GLQ34393.1 cytochrome c biogenesis protein CcdA [Amylibacter marinus]